MNDLVDIKNLSKIFPKEPEPALKNISAIFPKGVIVGVVGADGAGKTTLIRLIAALLLPTTGEITVEGKNTVVDSEFIHYATSYMPQKFGLYEDLTVMQNLTLYADLKGVVGDERTRSFEKLLKFTNLAPFVDRLAGNLSGGMKQKLGLACALIKKPLLLLLDEPSVGVDPISRRELWTMVTDLLKEGITVVWSTAYLDEAEKCDTVLLIDKGALLFHGKPKDLTRKVEGQVFKITNIKESKRPLLINVLQDKNVVDAVIQGDDIRVVLKKGADFSSKDGKKVLTPPRFEDAFIDILGGSPKEKSELAKIQHEVSAESKIAIVAENLTKKFDSFVAVDDISFQVKRGEIFGLLGPNGAGKTTVFKMMCGLLMPTSGKAIVNDWDLQHSVGEAKKEIGYMAQKFSLYGSLSVKQNLNFFSGIYGLQGKTQKEAIDRMIDIFHLDPYLDISADLLPLGFKQRLSLACATMHQPEIIFLDEPTSGVDPVTRREFWIHINALVEKGVTVMVTTHFMEEAEYCDRIALIYQGHIVTMDTPQVLKENVATKENNNPTLEDAFVRSIEEYDSKNKSK